MNHVHGSIPLHVHIVLSPGQSGLMANFLQSADVARLLAAEPGARGYSLDCTLLDLLNSGLPLAPLEVAR